MKKRKNCQNEDGFVLVAALLILLVLTIMGIAVNRNTLTEWRIAMNDRTHKETFFVADAATELSSEVLEQSIACLGFGANNNGKILLGANGNNVFIDKDSLGFWRNYSENGVSLPTDANRDLVFPAVVNGTLFDQAATDNQPHANINIGGNTKLTAGSAIQMAAGYEGTAKGIGTGGATLMYDINVQQVGRDGSISNICIQYGHILGTEGLCNY